MAGTSQRTPEGSNLCVASRLKTEDMRPADFLFALELLRRDSPLGYSFARFLIAGFGPLGLVALVGAIVVHPILLWIVAISVGLLIETYLLTCFFLITDIDRKREWREWRDRHARQAADRL